MAHHCAKPLLTRLSKFRALITDVQGTLIPSGPAEEALTRVFAGQSFKVRAEDIVSTGIGRPKREHIAALWTKLHGKAPSRETLDAVHEAYQLELAALLQESETMDFVPGARETLAAESIPCGFVTGFDRCAVAPMLLHWSKQGIVFDAFGTADGGFCSRRRTWDQSTLLSGDAEHSKSAQIEALLTHWNVEPASALFLGDTPYDMRCAREAGCGGVVGVTDHSALQGSGVDVARVLRAAGAHATVNNWWPICVALDR